MRLALYSGGDLPDNEDMDAELLRLLGKKKPKITFIPSSIDDAEYYFEHFIQHYNQLGFDNFFLFPVDTHFTKYQAMNALRSDLIYLSGGNTFHFLKHMKESGMAHLLREYARKDSGVIAGQSAGSIIMTPTIETAAFPSFDRDDNLVGLKNLRALNLTHFEFFPHFSNTRNYIHALNLASTNMHHPIYACPDGSGIILEDLKTTFVGSSWGFFRGKKYLLSP